MTSSEFQPYIGKKPASRRSDAPTPEALALDIPGCGASVLAVGLRTATPVVTVDGRVASKTPSGGFKIPLTDGTTDVVKIKAFVPGYPTIVHRDIVLFRADRPPVAVILLVIASALAGAFAGFSIIPGIATTLLAVFALAATVGWFSRAHASPREKYLPVVAGIVTLLAVGFAGAIWWS